MAPCTSTSAVVTRVADILSAVGFKVHHMQGPKRIDREQFELAIVELSNREDRREGDVLIVTGNHEDHGRTILRRDAGTFWIIADDVSLIPGWGETET